MRRTPGVLAALVPSSATVDWSPAPALEAPVAELHASHGNGEVLSALTGGLGMHGLMRRQIAMAAAGSAVTPDCGSQVMRRAWMRHLADDGATEAPLQEAQRSSGRPLPSPHLERYEQALGHALGHVRLHDDAHAHRAAQQLRAHAFALGADVFMGPGAAPPGTPSGDRLLAHELTHVVQHDEGRMAGARGVSRPSDPLEQEAYAAEARVLGQLDRVDAGLDLLPPGLSHAVASIEASPVAASAPTAADVAERASELGADAFLEPGPTVSRAAKAKTKTTTSNKKADSKKKASPERPKRVRLKFLGETFVVHLPAGTSKRVQVHHVVQPMTGVTLHGFVLHFDNKYKLSRGEARGNMRARFGHQTIDVPLALKISRGGTVRPSLSSASLSGPVVGSVSGRVTKNGLRGLAVVRFAETVKFGAALEVHKETFARVQIRDNALHQLTGDTVHARVKVAGIDATFKGSGTYAKGRFTGAGRATLHAPLQIKAGKTTARIAADANSPIRASIAKNKLLSASGAKLAVTVTRGNDVFQADVASFAWTKKEGLTLDGTVLLPKPVKLTLFGYGAGLNTKEKPVRIRFVKGDFKGLEGDFEVTVFQTAQEAAKGTYTGKVSDDGRLDGSGSVRVMQRLVLGASLLHMGIEPGLEATFRSKPKGLAALKLDGAKLSVGSGERTIAKVTANNASYDGSSVSGDFTGTLDPNFNLKAGPLSVSVKADENVGISYVGGELAVQGSGLEVQVGWKKGKGLLMKAVKWVLKKVGQGLAFVGDAIKKLLGMIDVSAVIDWLRGLVSGLGIPDWLVAFLNKLVGLATGMGDAFQRLLAKIMELLPLPIPWPWGEGKIGELFAAIWAWIKKVLGGITLPPFDLTKLWELLKGVGKGVFNWLKDRRLGGALSLDSGTVAVGLRGDKFPLITASKVSGSFWWKEKRLASLQTHKLSYDGDTFAASMKIHPDPGWQTPVGDANLRLSGASLATVSVKRDKPVRLGVSALTAVVTQGDETLATGTLSGVAMHKDGVDGAIDATLKKPLVVTSGGFTLEVAKGKLAGSMASGKVKTATVSADATLKRGKETVATAKVSGLGLGNKGLTGSAKLDIARTVALPLNVSLMKGGKAGVAFEKGKLKTLTVSGLVKYKANVERKPLPLKFDVKKGKIDLADASVTAMATATLKNDLVMGTKGRSIRIKKGAALSVGLDDSALDTLVATGAKLAAAWSFKGSSVRAKAEGARIGWTDKDGFEAKGLAMKVSPFHLRVGKRTLSLSVGDVGVDVDRGSVHKLSVADLQVSTTIRGKKATGAIDKGVFDLKGGNVDKLDASVTLPAFLVKGKGSWASAEAGTKVGLSIAANTLAALEVSNLTGMVRAGKKFKGKVTQASGKVDEDGFDLDLPITLLKSAGWKLGGLSFELPKDSVVRVTLKDSALDAVDVVGAYVAAAVGGGELSGVVTSARWDGAVSLAAHVFVTKTVKLGLGPWAASLQSGAASVVMQSGDLDALTLTGVGGQISGPGIPSLALMVTSASYDGKDVAGQGTGTLVKPWPLTIGGTGLNVTAATLGLAFDPKKKGGIVSLTDVFGSILIGGKDVLQLFGGGAYDTGTDELTALSVSVLPGAHPISVLDDTLSVTGLTGNLALSPKGFVVDASGHLSVPKLEGMHGTVGVHWKRTDDGDDFTGTQGLFYWKFFDEGGRKLDGTVSPKLGKGGLELAAMLFYTASQGISGLIEAAVDAEQNLVVEKMNVPINARLIEATKLVDRQMKLIPNKDIPLGFGGALSMSYGMNAAICVSLDDLCVNGAMKNKTAWKPLEGTLPDFEAKLEVVSGLDLAGRVMPYIALDTRFADLARLTVGASGLLMAQTRVGVGADAWLKGNKGKLSGGLGLEASIDPTLTVSLVPYVEAYVKYFYENGKPYELGEIGLGTLDGVFSFEWGADVGFGDEKTAKPRSPKRKDKAKVTTQRSKQAVGDKPGTARDTSNKPKTGPMMPKDLPAPKSAAEQKAPSDEGGIAKLMKLANQLAAVGRGIEALGLLVALVKDFLTWLKLGWIAALIWAIYEAIFGNLQYGTISKAVDDIQAAIDAGGELLKTYLPDTYKFVKRVFNGQIVNEYFNADDAMVRRVRDGDHMGRNADTLAQMCRVLLDGSVGGDDETALIRVLRYAFATGVLEAVVRGVGKGSIDYGLWVLNDKIDWSENAQLYRLLRMAGIVEGDAVEDPLLLFGDMYPYAHPAVFMMVNAELMNRGPLYYGLTWPEVRKKLEQSPVGAILRRPFSPKHAVGKEVAMWLRSGFRTAGLRHHPTHEAALEPMYDEFLPSAHAGTGAFAIAAAYARDEWLWSYRKLGKSAIDGPLTSAWEHLLLINAADYLPQEPEETQQTEPAPAAPPEPPAPAAPEPVVEEPQTEQTPTLALGMVAKVATLPEPSLDAPDDATVREVLKRSQAGNMADGDAQILLKRAVVDVRKAMMDMNGEGPEALTPDKVSGRCGAASNAVIHRLEQLGVDPKDIALHQTSRLLRKRKWTGKAESKDLLAQHTVVAVKMPNGKAYLIDTTHAQFHGDKPTNNHALGRVMRSSASGKATADALLEDGFVELTDETADAFAKGMREKNGRKKWKPADYFDSGNRKRARKWIDHGVEDDKAAKDLKADIPNDISTGDTQGGQHVTDSLADPPV